MPPPMMRTSGGVALTGQGFYILSVALRRASRATMPFMSYEHASSSFAWRASSFENPADYVVELTSGDRGEMLAAVETLERSGRLSPVHALTKTDFPSDELRKKLDRGYAEVRSGKGFVVLRGLPFEGLSLEQFTACAWGVGLHFGRALSQNAQGELVTSVIDATAEDATPRMYRSNLELRPHSDIAAGQRERGVPLDERDIEALNLFDQVAAAPENRLAFLLERGDMIVINNYTVMHARTRFTNFPEPERQRRLVRLWFDAEDFRDVPSEFKLFAENGIPKQKGRRATFDFKKLYSDDPVATGGVPDLKVSDGEAAQRR